MIYNDTFIEMIQYIGKPRNFIWFQIIRPLKASNKQAFLKDCGFSMFQQISEKYFIAIC